MIHIKIGDCEFHSDETKNWAHDQDMLAKFLEYVSNRKSPAHEKQPVEMCFCGKPALHYEPCWRHP